MPAPSVAGGRLAVHENDHWLPSSGELDDATVIVEQWFSASMDRVAHRFAGAMRGATIVLSFILAFALHLDAIELLSRLSSSAELRQSLVLSSAGSLRPVLAQKVEEEETKRAAPQSS